MSDMLQPRPEFRAHLEWQVQSALRRESRFAAPAGRRRPTLGAVVAFVAAIALGAGVVGASGEIQEARERDALIDAMRSEEALAKLRMELARAAYQDAQQKYEVGTAGRETVQAAEGELRAMEAALKRLAIDAEEIQATAKAPRNDLQAPLVGTRDFVSERMALDLQAAQRDMIAAEQMMTAIKRRFDVGLAPGVALRQGEADLMQARLRMEQLRDTLDLRRRALAGAVKLEEIQPALRRLELRLEAVRIEVDMQLARARIDELRKRLAVGTASEIELKRAELELLERQTDLQRVRLEIEKLAGGKRE
jgi:hypothetical protein